MQRSGTASERLYAEAEVVGLPLSQLAFQEVLSAARAWCSGAPRTWKCCIGLAACVRFNNGGCREGSDGAWVLQVLLEGEEA